MKCEKEKEKPDATRHVHKQAWSMFGNNKLQLCSFICEPTAAIREASISLVPLSFSTIISTYKYFYKCDYIQYVFNRIDEIEVQLHT